MYAKSTLILPSYLRVYLQRRRGGSAGIATSYGLDDWVSIPGRGKRFFSIPQRPDRLWGPPSLLSSAHQGLFRRRGSVRGVKLTIYYHLGSRGSVVG
jgi:hypothetical protein